jgi:hypothetical protein
MRLLALACALLSSSLIVGDVKAQPAPAADLAQPRANPSVTALVRGVNDDGRTRQLDVRKLDVRVRLRGSLAETVMEMRVLATTPEPVEGRVRIALPAGSIVTGYAIDINGAMVEGSLVDAPKAKAAYEQQLRKNIDPGLAEIDAAGAFSTRVSPIDDKKGRTIRLRFVTPLGSGWELPLNVDARDGWSVDVASSAQSGSNYAIGLGGGSRAERDGLHESAKGALNGNLRIETSRQPEAVASRHATGEIFWQASGRLPAAPPVRAGSVRILWDRSRSRRDQDHAAELRRVDEAVKALSPQRIEWVAFSSGAPQRATLSSFDDVSRRAAALRYGGATSFESIAADTPADVCLLVSDGRATLDQSPVRTLPCRLFAIVSDRSADWARLGALTSASGGQLIETGTRRVDWNAPAIEAVLDAGGNRLDFVPLPAPAGQWRLATHAPSSGPVRVRVGGSLVERQPDGAIEPFSGEGAFIAAARLASLEGTASRSEYVALSRRYSIASPSLSFVVLETPEDYVRNDIAPPASYARMEEWRELRKEADEDTADAKAKRFDVLLEGWREQVAWWEKKFDLSARPQARPAKVGGGSVVSAPPPGSPAPPPPPPPPAAERDDPAEAMAVEGSANIVVTGSRVPQPNLTSASPVTVIGGQELRVAPTDVQISVSAWHPNREYLAAFDADPRAFDRLFAEWERKAGDVPSFYLDTADWLARHGRKELAVETLLSALDLPTADLVTVGMIAGRLERYGMLDEAVMLRDRQAQLDPDRPQARRLLALALGRRGALGRPAAKADLERAVWLLVNIAMMPIDDHWAGIDLISLVEANDLLSRLRRFGGNVELDRRLVRNLDSDVRVVIDWSNDDADIDLWVDEPNGERAIYGNPRTAIGGHLSNDMTDGYGPEEYFLRRAAAGRYIVRANVYSPDQLDPNGPSRVTAHLYRDWGRPSERAESIDLDLTKDVNGEVRIGTLTVRR